MFKSQLHDEFKRLWMASADHQLYLKEQDEFGATLAGIRQQERRDSFHAFVDRWAPDILSGLVAFKTAAQAQEVTQTNEGEENG